MWKLVLHKWNLKIYLTFCGRQRVEGSAGTGLSGAGASVGKKIPSTDRDLTFLLHSDEKVNKIESQR